MTRERFLAVLFNGPLLPADAVVVLAGEDGESRTTTAIEMMRQRAADVVVVTGGLSDESKTSAQEIVPKLLGGGVSPDHIIVDPLATNTREQAVNVAAMVRRNTWERILLVASPYHTPRAFLTFVRAFNEADIDCHIVPVPTAQSPWWGKPKGVDQTRLERLSVELEKCDEYEEHVATPTEGLDHLKRWEGA